MKRFKIHIVFALLSSILMPNVFQNYHIHTHHTHRVAIEKHGVKENANGSYDKKVDEEQCLICDFEFVPQILPLVNYQSKKFVLYDTFFNTTLENYFFQSVFNDFPLRAPPYKTNDIV